MLGHWAILCQIILSLPIQSFAPELIEPPALTKIADLDILLLLTVQQSCNKNGVKIPWDKVAENMGPKFTEGAIVQHLSKLRLRREAEGKAVPPPLRRSAGSTMGKYMRANAPSRKRSRDDADGVDEINNHNNGDDESGSARRAKARKIELKECRPGDGLKEQKAEDSDGLTSTDEADDPSWMNKSSKKRKRAHSSVKTKRKGKAKSTRNSFSRGASGFQYSSSEDDVLCVGASFLDLGDDDGLEADSNSSDPPESSDDMPIIKQESRIIRLPVSQTALHRLQSTGSLAESPNTAPTANAISSDLWSSPPTWPAQQQMLEGSYAGNFSMNYPQIGYHGQHSYQTYQQPSLYQGSNDFGCIDPTLLGSQPQVMPNSSGWVSAADFAPPAVPMTYLRRFTSAADRDWSMGHSTTNYDGRMAEEEQTGQDKK